MTKAAGDNGADSSGTADQPERVRFTSSSPYLLEDVGQERPEEVSGYLYRPQEIAEPAPAVVVVQGLGGPKAEREHLYGEKLAQAGYVALVVDSFGPRGFGDASDKRKALQVTTWALLADAFAALRYLADRPDVRRDAISIIGFSWGGMTAMVSVFDQIRRTFVGDDPIGFAAHASYYGCSIPRLEDPATTGAPVLVLVGEQDANVSIERTRRICDDMRRGGSAVTLEVLDVPHQWDGSDIETRHVTGSLADIHITIGRDNVMRLDDGGAIRGVVSRIWGLLSRLRWRGYFIRRDAEAHRKTDRMLLDFLASASRRKGGAPQPDGPVAAGSIERAAKPSAHPTP